METEAELYSLECYQQLSRVVRGSQAEGTRHPSESMEHYDDRVNSWRSKINDCGLVFRCKEGGAICLNAVCETDLEKLEEQRQANVTVTPNRRWHTSCS